MPKNTCGWECQHLLNDYLIPNPNVRQYGGFCGIQKSDLEEALHRLMPFESPDMYAVLDDKIVILEHFEFDASRRERRGGMQGKREENRIDQSVGNAPPDGAYRVEKVNCKLSFEDWIKNFETTFQRHYNRIDDYINHVKAEVKITDGKDILVGFFIENQYSPYVEYAGRIYECYYIETIQFLDFFCQHQRVDFILFGTYYGGYCQLFYVDHQFTIPRCQAVDLYDGNIKLSHLNQNEAVVYSKNIIDSNIE